MGVERHLYLRRGLRQERHGGSPPQAGLSRPGQHVDQGHQGKSVLPEGWCATAKKPSGAWIEYWWAKPGEKEGSRKLTYLLSAKGTSYVVAAGIYDDKASIAELSKLSNKK